MGRMPWHVATAIRTRTGRVHLVRSWNAYEGWRARCGTKVKHDDFWHVVSTERRAVMDAVEGTPCPKCLP